MPEKEKDCLRIWLASPLTPPTQPVQKGIHLNRDQIDKVTVVSNGFTCEMDADQFFKIIHEAFKW